MSGHLIQTVIEPTDRPDWYLLKTSDGVILDAGSLEHCERVRPKREGLMQLAIELAEKFYAMKNNQPRNEL